MYTRVFNGASASNGCVPMFPHMAYLPFCLQNLASYPPLVALEALDKSQLLNFFFHQKKKKKDKTIIESFLYTVLIEPIFKSFKYNQTTEMLLMYDNYHILCADLVAGRGGLLGWSKAR